MINGYAAFEARGELKPYSYEPKALADDEVEIAVTHCGIIRSDLHMIDNDWYRSSYPFIPGQEIVGHVTRKGSSVNHLNTGERVALGWQSRSCHKCEQCLSGNENLCEFAEFTCMGRNGGFADKVIADSAFVIRVPDGLASEDAGPLMCSGITVFAPLYLYGVKPGDKVGIVGIGGLGHFAIQFAARMGAEVTAISTSDSKREDAFKLGASHFINSKEDPDFKAYSRHFDQIVTTGSFDMNWEAVMLSLKPRANFGWRAAEQTANVMPYTVFHEDEK
jgi:Zn-dependent alcohol dehydrogenases